MGPNCSWTNAPYPKEIWAHGGRYEEPTVTAKVLFPQQESLQLQSEYHLSG